MRESGGGYAATHLLWVISILVGGWGSHAASAQTSLDVRGVVLDPERSPLPGVYVAAWEVFEKESLPTRYRSVATRPHPTRESALLVPRTGVVTDDRGEFTLRVAGSVAAIGEWRLDVSDSDHVPVRDLLVDAESLTVTLVRNGSIGGRILVDDWFEPYRVAIEVDDQRRWVSYDGSFEIDRLAPGNHRISFYLGFDREPAMTFDDVLVRPGERTVDDRLFPLDLTGDVGVVALEVVDELGQAVHGFYVAPLDDPSVAPWYSADSSLTIPTTHGELDVAVAGFPTRVTRSRGGIGHRRVVLSPPVEIELSVAGGLSLPERPLVLVPYIRRAGEEDPLPELTRVLDRYAERSPVDERRRAVVQVTDVGEYQVGFALLSHPDDLAGPSRLVSPLITVHVRETTGREVIPVMLDPKSYREAMRSVRGS